MIQQGIQILKNQGLKYVAFRATYEVKRKLGILKWTYPTVPKDKDYISFEKWKSLDIPFLIPKRELLSLEKKPNDTLEENYTQIKAGKIKYFNREWKDVNDWLTNPESNYVYDISKHWTEIEDLSKTAGDIKYVWEKSRFSYLYDIIRYDYHFESDSSEFVFNEIDDWIKANPLNMGPNYKCSQETSLRCLNWIFALYFYQDSSNLNEELWQKIMHSVYWQIKHVYSNIDFSRICVRNNHAITECMMIYFGGLLFPFLEEAAKWKKEGKQWLEEEIAYQVYEDGTFLQFSHNYQRVLMQLLTWTIGLSKAHDETLSETTLDRASNVVSYMQRCCVGESGQMPNYGSNDGALFFKLNDQDYTDFRPQINALFATLQGTHLYKEDIVQEDANWICQALKKDLKNQNIVEARLTQNFDKGGIYTLKDDQDKSFTFFKCTSYKDRPYHADNMHVDIWVKGKNYLRDSGTYKYNTDKETVNYFAGNRGHNTLRINNQNQMRKGPRFIWYNWTKEAMAESNYEDGEYQCLGRARMFPTLGNGQGLWHSRTVDKKIGDLNWSITDRVVEKDEKDELQQIWHPHPDVLEHITMSATDEHGQIIEMKEEVGYWSAYYGEMKEVPIWVFSTLTDSISTKIKIK